MGAVAGGTARRAAVRRSAGQMCFVAGRTARQLAITGGTACQAVRRTAGQAVRRSARRRMAVTGCIVDFHPPDAASSRCTRSKRLHWSGFLWLRQISLSGKFPESVVFFAALVRLPPPPPSTTPPLLAPLVLPRCPSRSHPGAILGLRSPVPSPARAGRLNYRQDAGLGRFEWGQSRPPGARRRIEVGAFAEAAHNAFPCGKCLTSPVASCPSREKSPM